MQIVAVDVGNSAIKFRLGNSADGTSPVEHCWQDCRSLSIADLKSDPPQLIDAPAHWYVSSVNDTNLETLKRCCESSGVVESWHAVQRSQIPLSIDLDFPDSVGIDRLLAAWAAHRRYGQNADTIVIDCGTALTIDLVSQDAIFRGGVIMAGPATNLLALTTRTAALPDLSGEPLIRPASVVGRSTRDAMLSGAWYNGLGAIREVVTEMCKLTVGQPVIIGTGGGLGPWRDVLSPDWILVDDLVLDGIFDVALQIYAGPLP